MEIVQVNSYLGFFLDGIHSTDLGIIRIQQQPNHTMVLPSIQDSQINNNGNDGTIVYNTVHKDYTINISFVYEGITQNYLNKIKQLLNSKKVYELILDEEPYKGYYVKIKSSKIESNYYEDELCTCTGTGKIEFQTVSPYAHSTICYLEDALYENNTGQITTYENNKGSFGGILLINEDMKQNLDTFEEEGTFHNPSLPLQEGNAVVYLPYQKYSKVFSNRKEYLLASELPTTRNYGIYSNKGIVFYNGGDLPLYLNIFFKLEYYQQEVKLEVKSTGDSLSFILPAIPNGRAITHMQINMKDRMFYGYKAYYHEKGSSFFNLVRTGTLHNEIITAGDFFALQRGATKIDSNIEPHKVQIQYLYL